MCKVLILFIIITFIKNPENAPNLLALDHHLPLREDSGLGVRLLRYFYYFSMKNYLGLFKQGFLLHISIYREYLSEFFLSIYARSYSLVKSSNHFVRNQ